MKAEKCADYMQSSRIYTEKKTSFILGKILSRLHCLPVQER